MRNGSLSRGTTLVELIIVIAVMSLLAGVVTIALRPVGTSVSNGLSDVVADSLRLAASDGRSRLVVSHDASAAAFVLPDGRVFADSSYRVEHLTGRPANAR